MSSEYFVDVVSNASMEIYPDNTISKFINRLATPLHLDGDWSVAVQEVFYPLSHKPIKRSISYFISYRGRRPAAKFCRMSNRSVPIYIFEDDLTGCIVWIFNMYTDMNHMYTSY